MQLNYLKWFISETQNILGVLRWNPKVIGKLPLYLKEAGFTLFSKFNPKWCLKELKSHSWRFKPIAYPPNLWWLGCSRQLPQSNPLSSLYRAHKGDSSATIATESWTLCCGQPTKNSISIGSFGCFWERGTLAVWNVHLPTSPAFKSHLWAHVSFGPMSILGHYSLLGHGHVYT